MMQAIITSFMKSLESILVTEVTLAPSTLRIPISLVRCFAINVANPNNPKQAINMASTENITERVPTLCSARYLHRKIHLKNDN